jgi:hypothetical protein
MSEKIDRLPRDSEPEAEFGSRNPEAGEPFLWGESVDQTGAQLLQRQPDS